MSTLWEIGPTPLRSTRCSPRWAILRTGRGRRAASGPHPLEQGHREPAAAGSRHDDWNQRPWPDPPASERNERVAGIKAHLDRHRCGDDGIVRGRIENGFFQAHGRTPRLGRRLLAQGTVAPPAAFRGSHPLGFPGRMTISGLRSHGPRARLPTHQPGRCRPDCKADCRPAGLSGGRAGLAPAGQCTEFPEVTA
jgi:hypothetical protein